MAHHINLKCVGCGACKRVCPESCISGESKGLHVIDPQACIDCGACGIVCPVSCIADSLGVYYQFLKPKQRPWAEVMYTDCSGCQYCTDICPFDCLEIIASGEGGYASAVAVNAHPERCVSCKLCIEICPRQTIELVYPDLGGERKHA